MDILLGLDFPQGCSLDVFPDWSLFDNLRYVNACFLSEWFSWILIILNSVSWRILFSFHLVRIIIGKRCSTPFGGFFGDKWYEFWSCRSLTIVSIKFHGLLLLWGFVHHKRFSLWCFLLFTFLNLLVHLVYEWWWFYPYFFTYWCMKLKRFLLFEFLFSISARLSLLFIICLWFDKFQLNMFFKLTYWYLLLWVDLLLHIFTRLS